MMNYATQYHIGCHTTTRKAKTKSTVQPHERIDHMAAKNERCRRNPKRQTEVYTTTHVANGFLTTTFLPKMKAEKEVQSFAKVQKIEADFYSSLKLVAEHYKGFKPSDTKALGYPYNITLSFWEAENYLKRKMNSSGSLRLMQNDKGKTFLTNEERYNTGATLYYIPVIPLYQMLKNKKTKRAARLLLSVFAYLYHVADIPYYRQESSYTFWIYEMITDWIEQDDRDCDNDNCTRDLKVAAWVGDSIEKKLFNLKNLHVFENRINIFKPKNELDKTCLQLAKNAYSLYVDYPSTNISIHAKSFQQEAEYDNETIAMGKYISFMAGSKGSLYETLAESINGEFNEYNGVEEPSILKKFDGSPVTDCNLDFENRLFPLIGDLCELLSDDENK